MRGSVLSCNVTVDAHCNVEASVVLPGASIGRRCMIRRAVIDETCQLPDGFTVGVEAADDRRRFYVTEKGVALVTPDMLAGQNPGSCSRAVV